MQRNKQIRDNTKSNIKHFVKEKLTTVWQLTDKQQTEFDLQLSIDIVLESE